LEVSVSYRGPLVDTCAREDIEKGLSNGLALCPGDSSGRDREHRQGCDSKAYVISSPTAGQSKQGDSKGNLAQRNCDNGYRELGSTIIYHGIEI
jgi:hypothetical protein